MADSASASSSSLSLYLWRLLCVVWLTVSTGGIPANVNIDNRTAGQRAENDLATWWMPVTQKQCRAMSWRQPYVRSWVKCNELHSSVPMKALSPSIFKVLITHSSALSSCLLDWSSLRRIQWLKAACFFPFRVLNCQTRDMFQLICLRFLTREYQWQFAVSLRRVCMESTGPGIGHRFRPLIAIHGF